MTVTVPFRDLRTEFSPLGKCMYCGSTSELSREHIVPYGLGGPRALPKSSCSTCAVITSKFEREVLRGPLWGLRAYLRLSSRRPSKMPKRLPFIVIRGGKEVAVSIPIVDHPIMLTFPAFSIPSLLSGKHVKGISIRGTVFFNFGRPIVEVLDEFKADDFRVTETSRPVAFARLIAKIAWGIAVISGRGRDLDDELRDAIFYNPNEIGRWVGTYTGPLEKAEPNMMHEIKIREDAEAGLLIADVKLFASSQTPRYGVILGKLCS